MEVDGQQQNSFTCECDFLVSFSKV